MYNNQYNEMESVVKGLTNNKSKANYISKYNTKTTHRTDLENVSNNMSIFKINYCMNSIHN